MTRWGGAVLVVGMHRSGTSCLAGCLEEAGLPFMDVNRNAPHNAKGNMENPEAMRLNDAVLAEGGGSWHDPPERESWSLELRRWRDEILAGYSGVKRFGLKDPRLIFVVEGWREALDEPRFVATFRHPIAVAASLRSRDQWELADGLALWLRYNRRLLELHDEFGFDIVSFDLPRHEYEESVARVATRLGLQPPTGGFGFPEESLRHHPSGGELNANLTSVYDRLLELAV